MNTNSLSYLRAIALIASNSRARFIKGALAATAIATAAFAGGNAQAALDTWSGAFSANFSDTSANWTGGATTIPASTDTLTFAGTSTHGTALNDNLTAGFQINAIIFSSSALTYTISGNAFLLGTTSAATSLTNSSTTALETINDAITLNNAVQTFSIAAGGITLGGNVTSANTSSGITLSGAGALNFSGGTSSISGIVTTANTAGESLNLINGANVTVGELTGGGATGGGVFLGSGSTLTVGTSTNLSGTLAGFAGVISGAGGLTTGGTGNVTLSGSNTYTGATTINTGTLTTSLLTTAINTPLGLNSAVTVSSGAVLNLSAATSQEAVVGSLAGGGNISLPGGSPAPGIYVGTNNTSTAYSGNISGPSAILFKVGTGTLTLSGTDTNSGGVAVWGGTLALNFGGTNAPLTQIFTSGDPLTLQGGSTLLVTGKASTANTQTFTTVNLYGGSTITLNPSTSNTLTLSLNSVHRSVGSVVNFSSVPNTTTNVVTGNFVSNNTSGFISGFTTGTGTSMNLATTSGSDLVPFTAYSTTGAGSTSSFNSFQTLSINGGSTTLAGGGSEWAAIQVTGAAGQTFTTASGGMALGVLLNSTSGLLTIANGGAGDNITVDSQNSNDFLVLGTNSISIAPAIVNQSGSFANGSANALTDDDAGTLTLSGSNTYTGGTFLDAGTLNLGIAQGATSGPLGGATASVITGTVTFGGGTLQYSSVNQTDYSGKIGNSTGPISIDTNGYNVTFASSLGSSNSGGLTKIGSGLLTLSASNAYTGTTILNGGSLVLSSAGSLGGNANATANGLNNIIFSGGTVVYGVGSVVDFGSRIAESASTININTGTFTETLSNIEGNNTGGLTKSGTGSLTLGGANFYTGTTTVNGGTLNLSFATAGAPLANSVVSSSPLVLAGGTIELTGTSGAGGTQSQTFAGTTISSGINGGLDGVNLNLNSATSLSLALGAITGRTTGTVLDFTNVPNTTSSIVTTSTGNTTGTGILGPWAAGGTGSSLTYLQVNGNNQIVAYTGTAATTWASINSATGNYTANGTLSGTGSATANTLDWIGTFFDTQTIGTGSTLTVNGLMAAGSSGGFNISGGTIATGSTGELVIIGNSNTSTIGSLITGGAVTFNGTAGSGSILSLTNTNNSFSGPLTIDGGILEASTFGPGTPTGLNSALVLANVSGVSFQPLGSGTVDYIGSLSGGGTAGGNITSSQPGNELVIGTDDTSPAAYAGSVQTEGIQKVGTGTLTLAGSNTIGSNLYLDGGGLKLDFSGPAAPASNIVNSASALFLTGGSALIINGNPGGTNIQTFNSGTYSGGSTITLNQNGAVSLTLNLGTPFGSGNGGGNLPWYTVNISTSTGAAPSTSGVVVTYNNNIGIKDGIFSNVTVGTGTNISYAGVTSGDITAYTSATLISGTALAMGGGDTNYVTSGTSTLTGAQVGQSLQFTGSGSTVNLNGNNLKVYQGILNSGSAALTIQGTGTLTNNDGNGSVFYIQGNSQAINISSNINAETALVYGGAGILTLSGSNISGSGLVIDNGVVDLNSVGAAGTQNILFGGGTLQYSTNNTTDYSTKIVGSSGSISIDTNSQNVTFGSALVSSNSGGLTKIGAGTLTLSASNAYTGMTFLDGGTVNVGNAGSLQVGNANGLNNITFQGGQLQYGTSNSVDYSSRIAESSSAISIDTNGKNVTYASSLAANNTGGLTLVDSAGTGTLTLTASNGYSGTTTIGAGGTLALSGAGSFNNSAIIDVGNAGGSTAVLRTTGVTGGNFSVVSGQTLQGIGTVNDTGGTVTIASGATLAPGNAAVGQLAVTGNLSLSAGSITDFFLGGSTTTSSVAVTGSLNLGGTLAYSNTSFAGVGTGSYLIFTDNGTVTGSFSTISSITLSGTTYTPTVTESGDNVYLNILPPNPPAGAAASQTVNVAYHVGVGASTSVTLTNTATSGTATLQSNGFSGTSTNFTTSGSVSGIAAGASGSGNLMVGAGTLLGSGVHNGTTTLALQSNVSSTLTSVSPQTITIDGTGYNLAASTTSQTVNVGNVHAGNALTAAVTLTNTAPTDATYTETLQTNGFSGTSTNYTATGSASGIAGGSSGAGSLLVGLGSGLSEGAASGTTTLALQSNAVNGSGLGTTNILSDTITITGGVYDLAASTTSQTVNVGNVHAGNALTAAVTLTNTAPTNATYTETLQTNGFSGTSANYTATGSASGIAGGSSGAGSLLVGLGSGLSEGAASGTTTLALQSNAVNGSGLGTSNISSDTITITGGVYDLAASTTSQTVNVGNVHAGNALTAAVTLTNTAPTNATYTETLQTNGFSGTSANYTATGSASGIAGGSSGAGSLLVGLGSGLSEGAASGTTTLALQSNAVNGSGLGTSNISSDTITITGGVYDLAASTTSQTVNVGNVHAGNALTAAVTLTNTAPTNATYTETLQTNGFSGTSANYTATGSASGIAGGSSGAGSLLVGLGSGLSEGAASGTTTLALQSNAVNGSGLGTSNISSDTITITGGVYDLAASTTSQTVNVGNVHAGNALTAAVTLTNTAPTNATYTETLQTNGFSGTSANYTATGSASGIAGGSSGAGSLLVGLGSGLSEGAASGTTTLALQSNAVNGSGLGTSNISSDTITITGGVYDLAASTTSQTVNVGNVHAGNALTAAVTLTNTAPTNATYTETLQTNGFSGTSANYTATGSASGIAGGSSGAGSLLVGLGSGLSEGAASGTTTLALQSNAVNGSGLGTTNISSDTITITGGVYDLAASTTSQTVNLAYHVGVGSSAAVTLTNTAPTNATYTETLQTNGFSGTSANFTASGSASGIAGGSSGSGTLMVGAGAGLGSGVNDGTTTLALQSNEVNGSGLGTTNIGSQTININTAGYNLAASTTSQTVDVGFVHVGGSATAAVTLTNTAPTDATYTETLQTNGFSGTSTNFTASGSASGIAGGASGSGSLLVGLGSGLGVGAQSGTTTLALQSNEVNGSGLGTTNIGSQTITINGLVYSGTSTWTGAVSNNWGTVASEFGSNWGTNQGSPGLDPNFTGVDTATFASISGDPADYTVNLLSASPNLNSITFDAPNTSYTIGGMSDTGTITLSQGAGQSLPTINVSTGGGSQTIAAPIFLGANTTVKVATGQKLTLSGVISDPGESMTYTGPGTTIVTGANTYSGGTSVTGGTLLVNNTTGSGTGSGSVAIGGAGSSPTLGGNGTLDPTGTSTITVDSTGTLAPGTPGNTDALTISSTGNTNTSGLLDLTGATLAFNLNSTIPNPNLASDLNLTGAFASEVTGLSGNTFNFTDLTVGGSGLALGEYTLILSDDSTTNPFDGLTLGTLTGFNIQGLTMANYPNDTFQLQLNQLSGSNNYAIQLDISEVPEPGTWALMLGGLALLIVIQRRKNKMG